MKRFLFYLLPAAFLLILGSALFADNTEIDRTGRLIREKFSEKTRMVTLDNGLRLIMVKNALSPTVAAYLKIGVGSSNESFDIAGTAHFLEHLLFKGTDLLGTRNYKKEKPYLEQIIADGERLDSIRRKLLDPLLPAAERSRLQKQAEKYEKRLKLWQSLSEKYILSEEDSRAYSLAGQMGYNAYTTSDVTNYQIKLPANRLELWAALESRRFLKPVFREYYKERSVILEERYMRYDSRPANLLYELYLKTTYGMSPYGKPVIGFAENIPRMRYSDTLDFFNENYIPSRMVIALVGDIDYKESEKIIRKYFGRLKPADQPEFPPITSAPPAGRKTATLQADHQPYLITGWRKPSVLHEDNAVFEVIENILAGGDSSRLVKRLVKKEKLASYVYTYNGAGGRKLPNSFAIFAGARSYGDYDQIEKIIREEIEKLAAEGPTAEELTGVKNRILSGMVSSFQKNAGIADALSYYEVITGDYRNYYNYIDTISAVDGEDISRVLKKWFIDKNNTTVYMQKKSAE